MKASIAERDILTIKQKGLKNSPPTLFLMKYYQVSVR